MKRAFKKDHTALSTRILAGAATELPIIAVHTPRRAFITSCLRTPLRFHSFLPMNRTPRTKDASSNNRRSTTNPGLSLATPSRSRLASKNTRRRERNLVSLASGARTTLHKPICSQSKYSASKSHQRAALITPSDRNMREVYGDANGVPPICWPECPSVW